MAGGVNILVTKQPQVCLQSVFSHVQFHQSVNCSRSLKQQHRYNGYLQYNIALKLLTRTFVWGLLLYHFNEDLSANQKLEVFVNVVHKVNSLPLTMFPPERAFHKPFPLLLTKLDGRFYRSTDTAQFCFCDTIKQDVADKNVKRRFQSKTHLVVYSVILPPEYFSTYCRNVSTGNLGSNYSFNFKIVHKLEQKRMQF